MGSFSGAFLSVPLPQPGSSPFFGPREVTLYPETRSSPAVTQTLICTYKAKPLYPEPMSLCILEQSPPTCPQLQSNVVCLWAWPPRRPASTLPVLGASLGLLFPGQANNLGDGEMRNFSLSRSWALGSSLLFFRCHGSTLSQDTALGGGGSKHASS